ncbi:MAG: hypothetical protein M1455_10370 [Actinobacteria bacterium]|nr:hypothetical protein [Actinomycetota bacterium]
MRLRQQISVLFGLILLYFVLFATGLAGGDNWTWTSNGPNGGVVDSVAPSPCFATDHTIFAGALNGGVFKTINAGSSWSAAGNVYSGLTDTQVMSLVISPNFATDNTLFAGTGSGGVFKSTDAGSSWNAAGNVSSGLTDTQVLAVALSPNFATDNTLFAGTGSGGVFKSTDAGSSWNAAGNVSSGLTSIQVLAVALSPGFATDHTLFAGTESGGVFKSTDAGSSWNQVSNGLSLAPNIILSVAVSPDFTNDHTLYAASLFYGLYRSTDGGASWNRRFSSMAKSVALSPSFATDQTVIVRGQYGVYMSADAGATWKELTGIPSTNIASIAISPGFASDGMVFAGADNGVWSYAKTIPASNVTPSGWITTPDTHIAADLGDDGSGINAASISVYLDGSALSSCSLTSAHVDCPVSGLAEGHHNLVINYITNAGTNGYGAGSFDVDLTAPSISGISPTGWTKASTNITANLSDTGSGINTATASMYLDGSSEQLAGCSVGSSSIGCPVTGLSAGQHTVSISATDNAGNRGSATGGFGVEAVLSNVTPSGWITTPDTHIAADLGDDGSGINAASISVYLDGSALSSCSLTSAHVDCPVSGLAEGHHNLVINYITNAGTNGYGAGSFDVDLTAPSISGISPTGWTKASTNITANLSDTGSGINTATASMYLDGSSEQLAGCSVGSSSIGCPVTGLASGLHSVTVNAQDESGNSSSVSNNFSVDSAAPTISNMIPTGTVTTRTSTVSAYYSDADSGINPVSAKLTVNGHDATPYATIAADHISFKYSGRKGQNIHLEISDNVGNVQTADWTYTAPDFYSYYFPWYDNQGGRTWILGANPTGAADNSIDSLMGVSPLAKGVVVHGGSTVPMFFAGIMGGPIRVNTNNGQALISERSLFGNSFEEVWGVSFEHLDSHYFWPVYDGASMRNWILVANPTENGENIRVRVTVRNANPDISETRDLAPGQSWTPIYAGRSGGPVEVKAWKQGGNEDTDPRKLIASQRVLNNGAFNEMPGIPDWQLSSGWFWTWYDNNSPGASDWICIGNPNPQTTYVVVLVGKDIVFQGYIPANETQSVQVPRGDPAGMGGPVAAISCSDPSCSNLGPNIYATQRVIWGPSFSEISGYGDFRSNANWTWYDNANPGTTNWVLLSNLNSDRSIYAEIKIAGITRWSGAIPAFGNVTPTFPGIMAGPVEVKAWDDPGHTTPTEIFASQRVLWNGYFNELVGKGF